MLATRSRPTDVAPPQATPEAPPPAPERVLRGRVTGPDGHGVARIAVEIQFTSRRRRVPVICTIETNPDGAFETPIPPRAGVALVWTRDTDRWISHPGVVATGWGLLMWHTSRGEEVLRDASGRPWKPHNQTRGIWPEVPLRVRPARTVRGRVVPSESGLDDQDLCVLVEAHWPDPTHVECSRRVRASDDGTFELRVPCDALPVDIGIPARTRDEWDDERTDLVDALVEEGADDEAIEAARATVRNPYPGFWLPPLRAGEDDVVLHLAASHELAYAVSVEGEPVGPREVSISMALERRDGIDDGLDVRPHCTLSGASCLAAGRYRLTVRSVAEADGRPLFSGSVQADVPGPPVVVDCRRP